MRGLSSNIAVLGAFVGALLLAGCDYEEVKAVGPYRLSAIDLREEMGVNYKLSDTNSVGRVAPTVFAIGWNHAYIVAARHPYDEDSHRLDKIKTEYFYVIRALDSPSARVSDAVRGPYDDAGFSAERARLSLPSFQVTLADLK